MSNRQVCVMKDYNGPRVMWSVFWNREGVSATVWERVPFCSPLPTAAKAMALARMSVNDLSPFKRVTGRGNATYHAEQVRA